MIAKASQDSTLPLLGQKYDPLVPADGNMPPTGNTSRGVPYSRETSSPEYASLIVRYRDWHATHRPKQWQGRGLPFEKQFKKWVPEDAGWSVLDYGCGQGKYIQDQTWDIPGIATVTGYDPAVPLFAELPTGDFDVVVSKDVMEHLDPHDVSWVLDEIFQRARIKVFLIIGTTPNGKPFSDGKNTNTAVFPPEWWREQLDIRAEETGVPYYARLRT